MFQDGLATVGFIECFREKNLCSNLGLQSGIKFYADGNIQAEQGEKISSLNVQEIAREVLGFLPEMKLLNEDTFKVNINTFDPGNANITSVLIIYRNYVRFWKR